LDNVLKAFSGKKSMYKPEDKTKPSAFTHSTSAKPFLWFRQHNRD